MTSRPFTDFPRNEQGLVDNFIGTAYDTIKRVSDNIDAFEHLDGVLTDIENLAPTLAASAVESAMVPARVEISQLIGDVQNSVNVAEDFAQAASLSATQSSQSASQSGQFAGQSESSAQESAASAQLAIESNNVLEALLADTTDPLKGSARIGRQGLIFNTVAEVRTVAGRFEGDTFTVKNYIAGDTKGCKIGGKWRLGTPVVSDDGGMILQVPGDTSGYWERDLNDLGEVDGEVYGLPLPAGQDSYDKLEAMAAYCDAVKLNGFLGKGPMNKGIFVSVPIYDTFERSFPVSGPRDPGQPIRKFGWGIRSERGVTFQTTSFGGADVFNLCSMSDWWLTGFPTIKGFLTGFSGSGSNGVSMVFGGENLLIEADPFQMPQIWISDGGSDGGHGFTIQYGTGNTNPYKNVKFRGHPRECTSGVNIDFGTTNTILYPMQGVIIDKVIAEDCYRGLTRGGTTPDASIVDPRVPQPCVDISGEMTIINCQQSVIDARSLGGNMVISIINTKEKAALVKNPNDTSVEVARVLGSKFGELMINARVLSVDKVLTLGSITMGGNAYPSVENFKFGMNVRYTSATTEFDLGLATSPPCKSSSIELTGFENVPSAFLGASLRTSLKLNGRDVTPTLYAGDAPAEPGPGAVVIFDTALTAVQPVYAPPAALCVKGDPITVIRTAAATGGGVTFAGVSVAVGTKSLFIYNGSTWTQMP